MESISWRRSWVWEGSLLVKGEKLQARSNGGWPEQGFFRGAAIRRCSSWRALHICINPLTGNWLGKQNLFLEAHSSRQDTKYECSHKFLRCSNSSRSSRCVLRVSLLLNFSSLWIQEGKIRSE
ncbi:hypothetical protein GUJ93_ZPchr0004g39564 [Zizania palustris]|uniref:Uncharacterized protein n=1 Tax=Zizania palustris TaxID=103762 RepID=A0A8J5VA96_ZIZPA|nr:hypothetical protein GUJ93_ZPchr0004g39564 [Zizania palustris]